MENNIFLAGGVATTVKGGGGGFIEDPRSVQNIVFQTRARPLCAFEAKFADDLMAAFEDGADTLTNLVAALCRLGSTDPDGSRWTENSLAEQLKRSGDALFATTPSAPTLQEKTRG